MKFRHEVKHYISIADYYNIKIRLKSLIHLDNNAGHNGEYIVRSLYFDNCYDKALREKVMGQCNREKFRIRYYNDNLDFIKLEKKSKVRGLCAKVSETISKEECKDILDGNIDFLRTSSKKLFNELYIKMTVELLKPKTIVEYRREAYMYDMGNVRITFDKNIRKGIDEADFLNKDIVTVGALGNNNMILEVKWDEYLPEMIQSAVQVSRRAESISKYVLCRLYN